MTMLLIFLHYSPNIFTTPLTLFRCSLTLLFYKGYIMPSVVLTLTTPSKEWRNRGLSSIPRAKAWIGWYYFSVLCCVVLCFFLCHIRYNVYYCELYCYIITYSNMMYDSMIYLDGQKYHAL